MGDISFRFTRLIEYYNDNLTVAELIIELAQAPRAAIWCKQLGIVEKEYRQIVAIALSKKILNANSNEMAVELNNLQERFLKKLKYLGESEEVHKAVEVRKEAVRSSLNEESVQTLVDKQSMMR